MLRDLIYQTLSNYCVPANVLPNKIKARLNGLKMRGIFGTKRYGKLKHACKRHETAKFNRQQHFQKYPNCLELNPKSKNSTFYIVDCLAE